jgi:hypothetical protein
MVNVAYHLLNVRLLRLVKVMGRDVVALLVQDVLRTPSVLMTLLITVIQEEVIEIVQESADVVLLVTLRTRVLIARSASQWPKPAQWMHLPVINLTASMHAPAPKHV